MDVNYVLMEYVYNVIKNFKLIHKLDNVNIYYLLQKLNKLLLNKNIIINNFQNIVIYNYKIYVYYVKLDFIMMN